MNYKEEINWWNCFRLFVKTIMGNAIPIALLFEFHSRLKGKFDGTGFWSIYAICSAIAAMGMWYVNRTKPDPTHRSDSEVPSPKFGLITATFPVIVFLCTFEIYKLVTAEK